MSDRNFPWDGLLRSKTSTSISQVPTTLPDPYSWPTPLPCPHCESLTRELAERDREIGDLGIRLDRARAWAAKAEQQLDDRSESVPPREAYDATERLLDLLSGSSLQEALVTALDATPRVQVAVLSALTDHDFQLGGGDLETTVRALAHSESQSVALAASQLLAVQAQPCAECAALREENEWLKEQLEELRRTTRFQELLANRPGA